ncbi:MAG TPA: hypothetical protein VLD13_00515 [Gaiellaceae bacterium]|nr:hypothetical protein [Gaiellaceae bacterium]
MEDQDRETRIDEDVEGHSHKMRNLGKDEGEDVEGHSHKMRNLGKDDEADDVEAHVHKANVNLGQHKA